MYDVVFGALGTELTAFPLLLVAGNRECLFKQEAGLKQAFENDRPLRFLAVMERESKQAAVLQNTAGLRPARGEPHSVVLVGFILRKKPRSKRLLRIRRFCRLEQLGVLVSKGQSQPRMEEIGQVGVKNIVSE